MSRRVSQGMHGQGLLIGLVLALLCGCATGRQVRLETDTAPPRVFVPRAPSKPVEVAEAEFREALSRWVLEVPLPLRSESATSDVVSASAGDAALVDHALQRALRLDYGRWCQRHETPGDCLSLLRDGLHLSARDRLTLAVSFSLDTVWDGVEVAVEEHLSPTALKALMAGFLASYVLMLTAPEPFITKGVAVVLTGYLIAWLGMGPLWTLVQASRELVAVSEKATTFAQLEEAGHRFGRVLGENGARILILAATAGLGGRQAMLARGPRLPGFAQAVLQAERQLGLRLVALGEVQSIALTPTGGIVVRLTSGAVSATALGVSPSTAPSTPTAASGEPLQFELRTSQPGQSPSTRWVTLNGRTYSINSGHAWSRGHQSGVPPSSTGIQQDALESALIRNLDDFIQASGTVPPPSRINFDRHLTLDGVSYGYRSVSLPSGEVRVTTYWVNP